MRDYRVIPESDEGREIVPPLAAPTLICEAEIDVLNPEFCWNAVTDATEYQFQLATDIGFTNLLANVTGIVSTCYTYVGTLDYSTTYYWRVRAKRYVDGDLMDTSPWSVICAATTIEPPLSPPTLICESLIVTDNPEFCWDPVPLATSYDFQLASDSGFTTIIDEALHIAGPCHTYVGSLTELVTYYWRVRAILTVDGVDIQVTDWSATCTATTGVEPLDTPTLICVATITETDPQFCWNSVANATEYEFQLARDIAFTDIVVSETEIHATCYTYIGTLSDQDTYYWRVRAVRRIDGVIVATSSWSLVCTVSPEPVFFITGQDSTTVSMLWRHYPSGTTSFKLERMGAVNSDAYPYDPIDYRAVSGSPTAGGTAGTYTDVELLPGYAYTFRLTPQIGGIDQTPVLSDSTITNPNGALSTDHVGDSGQVGGGGMEEQTGPYTVLAYPYAPRAYYGGTVDVAVSTIEFVFKNTGTETGWKTIWGREDEESWGVGTILGYTRIEKNGTAIRFTLGSFFGDLFSITATLDHPIGETHTWAFVMDHNINGSTDHNIKIYRDAILSDSHDYSTSYRMRLRWIIPATLYSHKAHITFMKGVKGVIDEFRIWLVAMPQDALTAMLNKVIRSNGFLLYRWGFDNYTLFAGDAEFDITRFGSVLVDPQRPDDVAGSTPVAFNMKHIVAPLIPETGSVVPPTPVLKTPADGDVLDVQGGVFTWLSLLSEHDEFQLARDLAFTDIVYSNTNVVGQTISITPPLVANTTYYWRVRAVNGSNFSAWTTPFSVVCNFTVDLLMTQPVVVGRTEPFDADEELLMTQPSRSQQDEPFGQVDELLMSQPSRSQQDEPFDSETEFLMSQPSLNITDI